MRTLLFILSVIAFLVGGIILVGASGAIHEIEGFLLFLISTVLLSGAAIVEAINAARTQIEETLKEPR